MFARVSIYEGRPEQLDEMHHEGMEHVLPALEMQDGFSGVLVLADRQSGKALAVTLWESERWTLPRMPLTGCESSAPNPAVER